MSSRRGSSAASSRRETGNGSRNRLPGHQLSAACAGISVREGSGRVARYGGEGCTPSDRAEQGRFRAPRTDALHFHARRECVPHRAEAEEAQGNEKAPQGSLASRPAGNGWQWGSSDATAPFLPLAHPGSSGPLPRGSRAPSIACEPLPGHVRRLPALPICGPRAPSGGPPGGCRWRSCSP